MQHRFTYYKWTQTFVKYLSSPVMWRLMFSQTQTVARHSSIFGIRLAGVTQYGLALSLTWIFSGSPIMQIPRSNILLFSENNLTPKIFLLVVSSFFADIAYFSSVKWFKRQHFLLGFPLVGQRPLLSCRLHLPHIFLAVFSVWFCLSIVVPPATQI